MFLTNKCLVNLKPYLQTIRAPPPPCGRSKASIVNDEKFLAKLN